MEDENKSKSSRYSKDYREGIKEGGESVESKVAKKL